jgi:hypothetical protein
VDGRLAAGECADPQHELGKVERLGEVVVGFGDHSADDVAVEPGKVPVEDEHVVGDEVQLRDRVESVVRDVDGHALVAETLGDVVRQPRHVLHDKDPHERTLAGWRARVAPASSISTRSPPSGRREG